MLTQPYGSGAARLGLALCLALPWLNGFTAGPSPNFWPVWGAAVLGVAVLLRWRRVNARLMASAWLWAALLSSLMALLQYFGLATELSPWVNTSAVGQSYGNLRQRNQFASLTSIGLVCLLVLQTWRPAGLGARSSLAPAWAFGAAALLALGNGASSSRTGFLQWTLILALLLGVWVLHGRPREGRLGAAASLSLCAGMGYALALALLPRSLLAWQATEVGSMAERLAGSRQDSRRVLWDNVLHLIAQKPWQGWGWGELDYAHFITVYPRVRFSEILGNAHNLPLQLAVELGLPVAILLVIGLAALVVRAKPWRESESGRQLAWGVLGVIGVHSLLEYPLWYGPFHWAVLLCVLWLWRTRAGGTEKAQGAVARVRALPWVLAGLCWSALAWVGLDYARVTQLYLPPAERWSSFQYQPLTVMGTSAGSLFFQAQVDFARLVTTPLTRENAAELHALALAVLHYSPEPRVVEPLIGSAILLGRNHEASFYLSRYRAAFPELLWAELLQRHPDWALYLSH